MWLQYLNGFFCVCTQGFQNFDELFKCMNSLHPTIEFTMDYSTTEVNFLGVTVTKVCNKLETDLYCKPNDTHNHVTVMCIKYLLYGDRS